MSFFTIVRTAATFLPIVTDVVKSVEEIHAGDLTGAEKKTLALSIIESCYNATNPVVKFEDVLSVISGLVDTSVKFYNDAGRFVKSLKETKAA
jgi:hypothetical protein